MKFFVALLLVVLAAASPLKPLDDAFLNEHGHRAIFTEVIEKDDNFQFVEHADVVRTIGFCVRNFEKTGVSEAGQCISNSFKGRKVTLQLLKTLLKQTAEHVNADLNVDIVVSEDDDITVKDNLATWTGSGTASLNGNSVAYTKSGGFRVDKNRVTIEDLVNVQVKIGDNDVKAQVALYIDVDFESRQDSDAFRTFSAVNVNHGAGAHINNSDGTVVDTGHGEHAIINVVSAAKKGDKTMDVVSQATVAGTQIFHYLMNSHHDSAHSSSSNSVAVDVTEALTIDTHSDDITTTANAQLGVVSHMYVMGRPSIRQYASAVVDRTVIISGNKQNFSISAHDDVTVNGASLDYDDNIDTTVTGMGSSDNVIGVTVGSDNSLDVTGNASGIAKFKATSSGGQHTTVIVNNTLTAHVTATNDGRGNIKGHADLEIKVDVHTV